MGGGGGSGWYHQIHAKIQIRILVQILVQIRILVQGDLIPIGPHSGHILKVREQGVGCR